MGAFQGEERGRMEHWARRTIQQRLVPAFKNPKETATKREGWVITRVPSNSTFPLSRAPIAPACPHIPPPPHTHSTKELKSYPRDRVEDGELRVRGVTRRAAGSTAAACTRRPEAATRTAAATRRREV